MAAPYDPYFTYVVDRPENAVALLRSLLPAALSQRLDWGSLVSLRSTSVNPELRLKHGDQVFSVRLRHSRRRVLILFEHQSDVDWHMAERFKQYEARALDAWRKRNPRSQHPPATVCVVLYHGARAWNAPLRYEELLGLNLEEAGHEGWRRLLSSPEYVLESLRNRSEEELLAWPGPPLVKLALVLFRAGRAEALNEGLPRWVPLFRQVYATLWGREDLRATVQYVSGAANQVTGAVLHQVLCSVMTAEQAEELMLPILRQARKEGRAEGKAESLLKLLTARGIPVKATARKRILQCMDLALLDRWFDRALSARTLSDVLDAPSSATPPRA